LRFLFAFDKRKDGLGDWIFVTFLLHGEKGGFTRGFEKSDVLWMVFCGEVVVILWCERGFWMVVFRR
jgi:hypothetical protein